MKNDNGSWEKNCDNDIWNNIPFAKSLFINNRKEPCELLLNHSYLIQDKKYQKVEHGIEYAPIGAAGIKCGNYCMQSEMGILNEKVVVEESNLSQLFVCPSLKGCNKFSIPLY